MSGIRDALNQLPSRPGFVIGAVIALGLMVWHYGTSYAHCSALKQDRENLQEAIATAADAPDAMLNLALLVPGDWDQIRIMQGHRLAADQAPLNCPFGWDLSAEERRDLITRGDYTLLGFFRGDVFDHYIEFRRDWATFEGDRKNFPKDAARFKVEPAQQQGTRYRLMPAS